MDKDEFEEAPAQRERPSEIKMTEKQPENQDYS